jgi:hypothetical protein
MRQKVRPVGISPHQLREREAKSSGGKTRLFMNKKFRNYPLGYIGEKLINKTYSFLG